MPEKREQDGEYVEQTCKDRGCVWDESSNPKDRSKFFFVSIQALEVARAFILTIMSKNVKNFKSVILMLTSDMVSKKHAQLVIPAWKLTW